jgi:hypothetical protein
VLKVQRGELRAECKLSRQQKKSGMYLVVAAVLGLFAYNTYSSGNQQLGIGLGILAVIAILMGLSD